MPDNINFEESEIVIDENGDVVITGTISGIEKVDPPDHDQWLRQVERVQQETGMRDMPDPDA
jgi:2-keto-4-pentenoate hydratase/2-oxohepta-3-ene-1,7-dioic acid hydratase in catechol pathway